MTHTVTLTLNGVARRVDIDPATSLLDMLRDGLDCKSVKSCCTTGECGACTVILDGRPINSCVTLGADANGTSIVTAEGLAGEGSLHPVQQAFIDAGAVQCGYCTPGYVLSVKALLDRAPHPTDEQIEEAVSGNICRCTGYTKISDAIHLAASRMEAKS
jgi:carbon-monoxide dehydrogenase small subunit